MMLLQPIPGGSRWKMNTSDNESQRSVDTIALINKQGVRPYAVFQLVLVCLCSMFEGFDYMIVSYAQPYISQEWDLTSVVTGTLISWAMVGMIIGDLVGGAIADKIGRKKTMIGSVLMFSIFTVPVAFVNSYAAFAVCRIVAGLFIGCALSMNMTNASELAPTKQRTIFVAIAASATPLGYTLASVAAISVIPAFGWRPLFLIATVGLILGFILIPCMQEPPVWALRNGKLKETCDYLRRIGAGDYTPDELIIPEPEEKTRTSYGILFRSKRLTILLIGTACIYFCAMFTLYGVNTWYPNLMLDKGYNVQTAYGFSLAMQGAGVFGNLAAGVLLQKLGRRGGQLFGFSLAIAAILLLAWCGVTEILIIAFAMLAGFAINYLPSSINAVTPELFPTNARSSSISFVMATGRIAGMIAPVVAGALLGVGLDFSMLLSVFALPCVFAILLAFVFTKTGNKGISLDKVS